MSSSQWQTQDHVVNILFPSGLCPLGNKQFTTWSFRRQCVCHFEELMIMAVYQVVWYKGGVIFFNCLSQKLLFLLKNILVINIFVKCFPSIQMIIHQKWKGQLPAVQFSWKNAFEKKKNVECDIVSNVTGWKKHNRFSRFPICCQIPLIYVFELNICFLSHICRITN